MRWYRNPPHLRVRKRRTPRRLRCAALVSQWCTLAQSIKAICAPIHPRWRKASPRTRVRKAKRAEVSRRKRHGTWSVCARPRRFDHATRIACLNVCDGGDPDGRRVWGLGKELQPAPRQYRAQRETRAAVAERPRRERTCGPEWESSPRPGSERSCANQRKSPRRRPAGSNRGLPGAYFGAAAHGFRNTGPGGDTSERRRARFRRGPAR
jgi:hypothetical protein